MSDNDYIAEYVKEKYPSILGFDFAVWKMKKVVVGICKNLADIFSKEEESEDRNDESKSDVNNTECTS